VNLDIQPESAGTAQRLVLSRPDDWHLHLRDGAMLASVLGDTARQFARAIVMPNLQPPVTTVEHARAYRERILAVVPAGSRFDPLMTLYLTDSTSPAEIKRVKTSGFVHALNTTQLARRRIQKTA
jgi:dihydroorotase